MDSLSIKGLGIEVVVRVTHNGRNFNTETLAECSRSRKGTFLANIGTIDQALSSLVEECHEAARDQLQASFLHWQREAVDRSLPGGAQ